MVDLVLSSKAVDSILVKITGSYSFELDELKTYQEDPHIYAALLERMRAMNSSKKIECLGRLEDLGAAISDHPGYPFPLLVPYMSNPILIAFPETPRAAQILSKTGAEKARSLIRSNKLIRDQDEIWTAQALAKLGDSLQEDFLIKKYREEKDEGEKRDDALMLGFAGTPRTILALARDLRNPMSYEWHQTALRSIRVISSTD
jgi:hypothetical protein